MKRDTDIRKDVYAHVVVTDGVHRLVQHAVDHPRWHTSVVVQAVSINCADATKLTALVQNSQTSEDADDIVAAGRSSSDCAQKS